MDRLLTHRQAFEAMRGFLREFNRREPQSDRLPIDLLLAWTELEDDGRTSDPAQWDDWQQAVELATKPDVNSGPVRPRSALCGRVVQLRIDNRFSLVLEDDEEIVIEEPFELHSNGSTQIVPPSNHPSDVGAALSLLHQLVVSVRADPTGTLTIDFEGGDQVLVPISLSYENWQVLYSDGTMLIGLPGGGVSSYKPVSPAGLQE